MNYKVKIAEVNKSFSLAHHSYIDLGVFTVNATTYSFLFPAVKTDWACDMNDTELEFQVNNKTCKYVGFKELYTQLYGNSFATFEADLIRQIEEEVAKQIVKEYPGTDVNF
jgi:hypothetical protein